MERFWLGTVGDEKKVKGVGVSAETKAQALVIVNLRRELLELFINHGSDESTRLSDLEISIVSRLEDLENNHVRPNINLEAFVNGGIWWPMLPTI